MLLKNTGTGVGLLSRSLLLFSLLSLAACGTAPLIVQTKECPPPARIPRELLAPTTDLPKLPANPSSPITTTP